MAENFHAAADVEAAVASKRIPMSRTLPLRQERLAPPLPEQGAGAGDEIASIIEGLESAQAVISPKYLYDSLGSRLFEAITELPEYYPTRTEQSIFESHIGAIVQSVGPGATLIELGAGNGEKAAALFGALRPAQYVAVDISGEFLVRSVDVLQRAHPDIRMIPLHADITAGVALPAEVAREHRLFLYLGSSIGNFDPPQALSLLSQIRAQCGAQGGLLIGVDLVKEERVLNAAYDDALGVTAAFSLNALNHVNALIGSNFDTRDWRHRARYEKKRSRVELHLEAKRDVLVAWTGGSRRFYDGERIHMENSYKYVPGDFRQLLNRAGFAQVRSWTDDREWFAVFHAQVSAP
jgi:dimethylhistidine N-methyltransferase